jgi:hypothetical protein
MRALLASLLALGLAACHHHAIFPMDGTWTRGGISGDHFGEVVMQIADDGTRVTGVVCYTESGHLIYRDIPAGGSYPRVAFDRPGGGRFEGGVISPDTIDGFFVFADGFQQQWTFRKASSASYEACRTSRP